MNYIEDAIKTEPSYEDVIGRFTERTARLKHAADGMCTESGEFLDTLKKYMYYGKPIDEVNLVEELGDMLWYIAIAADTLGVTFEQIQTININKLKARYPNKFTSSDAINRDLDTERKILENGLDTGSCSC